MAHEHLLYIQNVDINQYLSWWQPYIDNKIQTNILQISTLNASLGYDRSNRCHVLFSIDLFHNKNDLKMYGENDVICALDSQHVFQ